MTRSTNHDSRRTPDTGPPRPPSADGGRTAPRRHLSLRTALIALALVPSIALIGLLGLASSRIWNQWRHMDAGTRLSTTISAPTYALMIDLQAERRLSEAAEAAPDASRAALKKQRARTDAAAERFRAASRGPAVDSAPAAVSMHLNMADNALDKLDGMRAGVDSGSSYRGTTFDYYTGAIQHEIALFTALGRVDDASTADQSRATTALFWGAEMYSREDALLARAWPAGRLTSDEYADFAGWVGAQDFAYSQQAAPYLPSADSTVYRAVTGSEAWAAKSRVESAVLGAHLDGGSPGAKVPGAFRRQWTSSADLLTPRLQKLSLSSADGVATSARNASRGLLERLLVTTALGLLGVLVVVLIVLRLTAGLRRRIAALRVEALDLQTRLPDVVDRLQRGEEVDTTREMPEIRYGADELGRLGEALNTARRTAVDIAVGQAEQYRGFEKLLQRIARRTQLLIGLQLRKLDEMERRHENPEVLEGLFDLDHLTARLRRYEENLVILGGGQPQRRWRKPARLLDVLRSAQGEVQDYTRIQVEIEGQAWIHERAVGPVVHVLAELMENAASFSKPPTPVEVRASAVGRGVAVEIEDRGLGMEPGQARAANAMMLTPPKADVLSRVDDIRLGLYVVARLASSLGIQVEFRPSAFGGTRVIVLVPAELIVNQPADAAELPRLGAVVSARAGRRAAAAALAEGAAPAPVHGGESLAEPVALPPRGGARPPALPMAPAPEPGAPEPAAEPAPEALPDHGRAAPAPEPEPSPIPEPSADTEPEADTAPEPWPEERVPGGRRLPKRRRGQAIATADVMRSRRAAAAAAAREPAPEPAPAPDPVAEPVEPAPAPAAQPPAPAPLFGEEPLSAPSRPFRRTSPEPPHQAPAEGSRPLPKRVRQASLAAGLRRPGPDAPSTGADSSPVEAAPAPRPGAAPRRAGAAIGAFQRQSRRSRAAAAGTGPDTTTGTTSSPSHSTEDHDA